MTNRQKSEKSSCIIRCENLKKIYESKDQENVCAIKNLSLDIKDEEFASVVGRSGCGKSTFLYLLTGVLQRTEGEIYYKGRFVNEPVSDIGMVFQEPLLLKWRTVLENVLLPAEILGLDMKECREKALELLDLTGIKKFKDKYPGELSGGMKQRTSICRSLIHDPGVLLMDEPFGALDALTRDKMNIELLKVWREEKKTIVFVTHYIPEAVFLSDKIFVLSDRPAELLDIVNVDLPRPRKWEITTSPKYRKIVQKCKNLIEVKREG